MCSLIFSANRQETFFASSSTRRSPTQTAAAMSNIIWATATITAPARGAMCISLCFNPSHLEFVNPVALGRVRAKQDRGQDRERTRAMALLIHGEAALAGEGAI